MKDGSKFVWVCLVSVYLCVCVCEHWVNLTLDQEGNDHQQPLHLLPLWPLDVPFLVFGGGGVRSLQTCCFFMLCLRNRVTTNLPHTPSPYQLICTERIRVLVCVQRLNEGNIFLGVFIFRIFNVLKPPVLVLLFFKLCFCFTKNGTSWLCWDGLFLRKAELKTRI